MIEIGREPEANSDKFKMSLESANAEALDIRKPLTLIPQRGDTMNHQPDSDPNRLDASEITATQLDIQSIEAIQTSFGQIPSLTLEQFEESRLLLQRFQKQQAVSILKAELIILVACSAIACFALGMAIGLLISSGL